MKKTGLLLLLPFLFFGMAFKAPTETRTLTTGTYGICFLNPVTEATFRTELIINDDNTFQYIDDCDAGKKINLKGTYTRKGNTIVLAGYQPASAIASKWTIDDNGMCLKSRKGLNFTRLCHLTSCK